MDNEIYQLVKHLSHRGLKNLSNEEKLILLWRRAVKKWNSTHDPTTVTLEDVFKEFKSKWPQIYGEEPADNTLYLSFGYIDYVFTCDAKGQVCGGIWERVHKKPRFPVNMTASQIVELAFWLRKVPFGYSRMSAEELGVKWNLKIAEDLIEDWLYWNNPYPSESDLLKQIVLNLQEYATNLYMLGNFEKSLEAATRAMAYLQLSYAENEPDNNRILESELYLLMSYNLTCLMRDADSNVCLALAYEKQMYVYERNDWKDVLYGYLTEEEREDISQDQRQEYLHWAWHQADADLVTKRPEYAISTLEKALEIAKDMNEKEDGRWVENIASISDRLNQLKSDNHE